MLGAQEKGPPKRAETRDPGHADTMHRLARKA